MEEKINHSARTAVIPSKTAFPTLTTITGENERSGRKTLSQCCLSTTNATWIVLSNNPGLCGERPVTTHLSLKQEIYICNLMRDIMQLTA